MPEENNNPSIKYPYTPTWCPGCGNYAIWGALKQGITNSDTSKENVVLFYDVGCSGNMSDFNEYYGFHALHGRALPAAVGAKLANHDLKVIVIIGDGGCYGEGGTHFINLMRGNHDVTVLVHDNHRYSLTTGQMSPTTQKGEKTKSTPNGSIEKPLNPLSLAISNHATFVAREFAGNIPVLSKRISQAINHSGFALIDILQPCVVFNPKQSYDWYRNNMIPLESLNHDIRNLEQAWKQSLRDDKLPIGLFYLEETLAYHLEDLSLKNGPLINFPIQKINLSVVLKEFS